LRDISAEKNSVGTGFELATCGTQYHYKRRLPLVIMIISEKKAEKKSVPMMRFELGTSIS